MMAVWRMVFARVEAARCGNDAEILASGLTKLTDEQIARSAAAHTGLKYQRRTPLDQCRWWRGPRKSREPFPWSPDLAYAVGLLATDGWLTKDGKSVGFESKDLQLVDNVLTALGRKARIRVRVTQMATIQYETQVSDVRLHHWLRSIGFTRDKSLTLGAIELPDEFFLPFARGLLEGDGTINNSWQTRATRTQIRRYELMQVAFHSASRPHLVWLRSKLKDLLGIDGCLAPRWKNPPPNKRQMFFLVYSKRAFVIRLLSHLYQDPGAPRLRRKFDIWAAYAARHSELFAVPS